MEYRVIKYKPLLKYDNYFEYKIQERRQSYDDWSITNGSYYEPNYKSEKDAIEACIKLRREEENVNTFEVIF